MINLTCSVLISSNKVFKDSSARYYQNNKERLQKKLLKDIKVFLKKKMTKSDIMVVNKTKIYQKMKNKYLLIIEKDIIKWEKTPYQNYKKLLFSKLMT